MSKFKIEDKVNKTYSGYSEMPLGGVWAVENVSSDGYRVTLNHPYSGFLSINFELVEEQPRWIHDVEYRIKPKEDPKQVKIKEIEDQMRELADQLKELQE